tara:strand:- start:131 stop:409 length:279 start_codon:yes stop_codon:yes gene_type:complete
VARLQESNKLLSAEVKLLWSNSRKQRAEVERLREALEPFADVSDFLVSETEGVTDDVRFDLTLSDSPFLVMHYTAKQFHDARAALAHGEADQ